jgi:hypothetical protein
MGSSCQKRALRQILYVKFLRASPVQFFLFYLFYGQETTHHKMLRRSVRRSGQGGICEGQAVWKNQAAWDWTKSIA